MIRKFMVFGVLFISMGILWAQPLEKTGNCPPLTRYNAPGNEDWGQFPNKPSPASQFPVGTIQNSLDPQESINCLSVPDGLKAQIIASHLTPGTGEGMAYPQYFDWDERGRLWVAEPRDYPGPIASDKANGGKGRILIFEDTDGDGAMDNFKVFREGLTVPNSIVVVKGGVVVTCYPQIFYIPNNNDVGGTPQVLFSVGSANNTNFDTHSSINSLMYSMDNWIYGITGWNGCNVSGVNCSGGRTWRFQHTSIGSRQTKFETWATGIPNAWGVGQMENGEIFQSSATTSVYSQHSIMQGEDVVRLVDQYAGFFPPTGDMYLWEGDPRNAETIHTAASGHDFYTARLLPSEFNTRFYVCEGATKNCKQDDIELDGSTWNVNRRQGAASRIIGSTDAWFAPLKARTGPDGGIWVVDWYNYLFLHNPATPAIEGTYAWVNHLREKSKSHMYRIIPADGSVDPYPAMNSQANLISVLGHSNMMWRLMAQRMLIYAGSNPGLLDTLEMILDNGRWVDDMDNDPIVTHAVWVLEGLGELEDNPSRWNPKLEALLGHPAWATRRNVLRALPRTSASAQVIVDACAVNDDHAHVRLEAMIALGESPNVSGEQALWSNFDNVDSYATTARNKAGVGTAGSRPCTPTYAPASGDAYIPVPIKHANKGRNIAGYALQFGHWPGYIELKSHKQLESGTFRLYDISGKEAFRSEYNSQSDTWSNNRIQGLNQGTYIYDFRNSQGQSLSGHLSVLR